MTNVNAEQFSTQKEYYEYLRKLCLKIKNNQLKIGQNVIKTVYPFLRNYKIEIEGEENIPRDSNVIFVVNHSTSHDIFTAYEFLSLLKRRGSVMVATDCLNKPVTEIFNISNATLLDRRNKEERKNAVLELSKKIIDGNDGVIFGEGTWNLHPILPMHIIQNGASKISSIAQVPIIPTIMEYIEVDNPVNSDAELFKKCIIRFGKPISNNYDISVVEQSNIIREEMSLIRKQLWNNFEIKREKISEIDPLLYVNHTYAKKFKALGFTYDSFYEQNYLLFNSNFKENEYTIDEEGNFQTGITEKNSKLREKIY